MKISLHLLQNTAFIGLIISLNLVFSSTVLAQNAKPTDTETKPLKLYDVEIILFKNIKVPKGHEKTLPIQAPVMDERFISFANQVDQASAAKLGFVILDKNENRLSDIANKIQRSSRYQFLNHLAWRQPGLAKEKAIAIQIRLGKQFGNDFSSIDPPVEPLLTHKNTNQKKIRTKTKANFI